MNDMLHLEREDDVSNPSFQNVSSWRWPLHHCISKVFRLQYKANTGNWRLFVICSHECSRTSCRLHTCDCFVLWFVCLTVCFDGTKRFFRLWFYNAYFLPGLLWRHEFLDNRQMFVCLFPRLLWYPGNNHPISKVDAESDVFVNLARWFFEHAQKWIDAQFSLWTGIIYKRLIFL